MVLLLTVGLFNIAHASGLNCEEMVKPTSTIRFLEQMDCSSKKGCCVKVNGQHVCSQQWKIEDFNHNFADIVRPQRSAPSSNLQKPDGYFDLVEMYKFGFVKEPLKMDHALDPVALKRTACESARQWLRCHNDSASPLTKSRVWKYTEMDYDRMNPADNRALHDFEKTIGTTSKADLDSRRALFIHNMRCKEFLSSFGAGSGSNNEPPAGR